MVIQIWKKYHLSLLHTCNTSSYSYSVSTSVLKCTKKNFDILFCKQVVIEYKLWVITLLWRSHQHKYFLTCMFQVCLNVTRNIFWSSLNENKSHFKDLTIFLVLTLYREVWHTCMRVNMKPVGGGGDNVSEGSQFQPML